MLNATILKTDIDTQTKWDFDPAHTFIGFSVKHLMISHVKGVFKQFDASIFTTGDDFTSVEIDFWINPASIDTGDEKRDAHLKSAEFFDVRNHKKINFSGNLYLTKESKGAYSSYGELTMKGITKQIKLDVEFGGVIIDPEGHEKAGFSITGKINRKEWGLNWNTALEAGGMLLGEEVKIECEIELIKQSQVKFIQPLKTNNKMTIVKRFGIWIDHANTHVMEFADQFQTNIITSIFKHQQKQHSLGLNENLMHNKEQHQQHAFVK